MYNSCTKCGRNLKNVLSQKVGMGPICRMEEKNANFRQQSLFNVRALYDFHTDLPGVLVIIDLDQGKSVTNDIENVLRDMVGILGLLGGYKIMYRDSQGIYDGINHRNGRFVSFFPLHESDEQIAYVKLMLSQPLKLKEE